MLRNKCAGKDMRGPPRKAGLFLIPEDIDGLIERMNMKDICSS
jgi:hypothetical protein